ncbi:MAG: hypothetical protein RRX94_05625, partial [Raoultibacter sp.]
KPEIKPEVKPEIKPEVKPEIKPGAKPEIKPEIKPAPEPKPEPKPEPTPEPKPASEPKPELKPEPKPEPAPELKPVLEPDFKGVVPIVPAGKEAATPKPFKPKPAKVPTSQLVPLDGGSAKDAHAPVSAADKKEKKSATPLRFKVAGAVLLALALVLMGFAVYSFILNPQTLEGGSATKGGSVAADGTSTMVYRYTIKGPGDVSCTAVETAKFDADEMLVQSSIVTELPDAESAKQFLRDTKTDFGTALLEGKTEGTSATVVIDETSQKIKKDVYTELLQKNAENCEVIG